MLQNYVQTIDDGHNTISLGICPGDGTLHVAFDAHCDGLRYGVSRPSVVGVAGEWTWDALGFSPVMDVLPGIEGDAEARGLLGEITYPRFLPVGAGELVFECRVGKAGGGSCVIFRYGPRIDQRGAGGRKSEWRFVGRYLLGKGNSPYVNGLSFEGAQESGSQGRIHVTWTNRHFVEYDDRTGTAHKQQAGPNGPENNADLGYVFSDDGGWMWRNLKGEVMGELRKDRMMGGVVSTAEEALVQKIERNSGIMNQEGQWVEGKSGRMHVLMRDTRLRAGECRWRHSWWNRGGRYWCNAIEGVVPTETGRRGKVGVDETSGVVYFVLPGNVDESLTVGRRRTRTKKAESEKGNEYGEFEILWTGQGYDGEPLIDEAPLRSGRLSVMTRTAEETRKVVVLDFDLDELSSS